MPQLTSSPKADGAPVEIRQAPPRVSWTLLNFWLDASLLITFLGVAWVTLVIRFVFPPSVSAEGWHLWGWNLDRWIDLQFVLLACFAFGILVHVMLHWSWICGVFYSKIWRLQKGSSVPDDGIRTIYGVGLLLLIFLAMGLMLGLAALQIYQPK
jgi:hypothetical protein